MILTFRPLVLDLPQSQEKTSRFRTPGIFNHEIRLRLMKIPQIKKNQRRNLSEQKNAQKKLRDTQNQDHFLRLDDQKQVLESTSYFLGKSGFKKVFHEQSKKPKKKTLPSIINPKRARIGNKSAETKSILKEEKTNQSNSEDYACSFINGPGAPKETETNEGKSKNALLGSMTLRKNEKSLNLTKPGEKNKRESNFLSSLKEKNQKRTGVFPGVQVAKMELCEMAPDEKVSYMKDRRYLFEAEKNEALDKEYQKYFEGSKALKIEEVFPESEEEKIQDKYCYMEESEASCEDFLASTSPEYLVDSTIGQFLENGVSLETLKQWKRDLEFLMSQDMELLARNMHFDLVVRLICESLTYNLVKEDRPFKKGLSILFTSIEQDYCSSNAQVEMVVQCLFLVLSRLRKSNSPDFWNILDAFCRFCQKIQCDLSWYSDHSKSSLVSGAIGLLSGLSNELDAKAKEGLGTLEASRLHFISEMAFKCTQIRITLFVSSRTNGFDSTAMSNLKNLAKKVKEFLQRQLKTQSHSVVRSFSASRQSELPTERNFEQSISRKIPINLTLNLKSLLSPPKENSFPSGSHKESSVILIQHEPKSISLHQTDSLPFIENIFDLWLVFHSIIKNFDTLTSIFPGLESEAINILVEYLIRFLEENSIRITSQEASENLESALNALISLLSNKKYIQKGFVTFQESLLIRCLNIIPSISNENPKIKTHLRKQTLGMIAQKISRLILVYCRINENEHLRKILEEQRPVIAEIMCFLQNEKLYAAEETKVAVKLYEEISQLVNK